METTDRRPGPEPDELVEAALRPRREAPRWLAAAACLAVLVALAGWGLSGRGQAQPAAPATPPPVAKVQVKGVTWVAHELQGAPVVPVGPDRPFLEFAGDSTYTGGDPCNGIGGTYRLLGEELTLAPGPQTEIGCNPGQQRLFHLALEQTRRVHRDGVALSLLDASGTVLARFVAS